MIVTRDGPHLFLYAHTRESCAEAERVVRRLLAEEGFEGTVRATRWHPAAEAWKDADEPMPDTPRPSRPERLARERQEAAEGEEPLHAPEFVLLAATSRSSCATSASSRAPAGSHRASDAGAASVARLGRTFGRQPLGSAIDSLRSRASESMSAIAS